jgi:CubicO group peptidase (beta-lactamase class C family)
MGGGAVFIPFLQDKSYAVILSFLDLRINMRLKIFIAGLLAGLFLLPATAAPHDSPAEVIRALDADLAAIADDPQHPLSSISVLAIMAGRVVYQKQVGLRYIDALHPQRSKPANRQTLYRIASISKMVTALGVMRLVEQGKLDLDADVGSYLGYPLRNPHFPEQVITLRLLMSHTSSLRDDAGYYNFDYKTNLRDVLVPGGARYGKGDMWAADHGPGYFKYTNFNWGVIGTIMERASGQRFDRLMKELILDPLDLHGGFNAAEFSPQDLRNLAPIYRKGREVGDDIVWDTKGPWVAQTDDYSAALPVPRGGPDYVIGTNGTVYGPQGSLRISAEGLGRIMLMLLHEGRIQGKQILTPESIKTMFAAQWKYDAKLANGESERDMDLSRGLGVQQFTNTGAPGRGDRWVENGGFSGAGHTGDAWGLTAAFVLDFAKKDGIIYINGGTGFDRNQSLGKYSGNFRYEELIMSAVYDRIFRAK